MNSFSYSILLFVSAVFAGSLCASCDDLRSLKQVKSVTLPSGKTARITSVAFTTEYDASGRERGKRLEIKYDTPTKDGNIDSLHAEADGIMSAFARVADSSGSRTMIVKAVRAKRSFLFRSERIDGFSYSRQPDGTWARDAGDAADGADLNDPRTEVEN